MPVDFKDYYETLGVPRQATAEEIKKAYRQLARRHHPDRAHPADKADAEARIKEINEAYEVLKDPEKRRRYDQLGAQWDEVRVHRGNGTAGARPFPGFDPGGTRGGREFHFGGTGFSDFFEQFFGAGSRGGFGSEGGRSHREATPRHGSPSLEADLMVELEEALHGAARPISLRFTHPESGREERIECTVRIPPGVKDGQRLRLKGRGPAWQAGEPRGDLLLRVRLAPHPEFRVDGHDLFFDLELSPADAVLGTKVTIPTLDGPARLTIPPGTPSGRRLRLRGRGLPHGRHGPRGDLFAVVGIRIPETLTAAEREAWERLAAVSR